MYSVYYYCTLLCLNRRLACDFLPVVWLLTNQHLLCLVILKSCWTMRLFNRSVQIFFLLQQSINSSVTLQCVVHMYDWSNSSTLASFTSFHNIHQSIQSTLRIWLYNYLIFVIWDKWVWSDTVNNIWCTERYWLSFGWDHIIQLLFGMQLSRRFSHHI